MGKKRKHKWRRQAYSRKRKPDLSGRNYNDPIFQEFRKDVIARDNYQCKWPGCKNHNRLQVHHILRWSDYPTLRFVRSNGITLCDFHHKIIKNCEDYYVDFFRKILEIGLLKKLKELQ
jgi:predicted restriction endonuclease